MIRVLVRDYVPPSKRPAGSDDSARHERDCAWRCQQGQQWQYAASFSSLYTCVSARSLSELILLS
jgi:hypothetical protein